MANGSRQLHNTSEPPHGDNLLEVRQLLKTYPETRAVDDISFEIARGSCFGLLGPNGAGKTTTLEILEGITQADAGEVWFRGQARDATYRARIGIQFQNTALQDFQSVREALELFASFYPRSRALPELVRLCQLQDLLERDTRRLSGGQRQRLLLALALVNDPELIFLDEPTTGLDPQSRHNFWHLINHIREEGKTILLTTHYMEEAQVLCDTVAILDQGRIIEQGAPAALLSRHFKPALVRLPSDSLRGHASAPPGFTLQNGRYEAAVDDIQETLNQLNQMGIALNQLQVTTPTLEDVFLKLTGKQLRH
jgi:ABC-2 type transport system ATP-binding protein